jgi:hypothetical protein
MSCPLCRVLYHLFLSLANVSPTIPLAGSLVSQTGRRHASYITREKTGSKRIRQPPRSNDQCHRVVVSVAWAEWTSWAFVQRAEHSHGIGSLLLTGLSPGVLDTDWVRQWSATVTTRIDVACRVGSVRNDTQSGSLAGILLRSDLLTRIFSNHSSCWITGSLLSAVVRYLQYGSRGENYWN